MEKYREGTALTYSGVLEQIKSLLDAAREWGDDGFYVNALEKQQQAIGLIQLLEVHNCGSTGGFDKGQSIMDRGSIPSRYRWLQSKESSARTIMDQAITQERKRCIEIIRKHGKENLCGYNCAEEIIKAISGNVAG